VNAKLMEGFGATLLNRGLATCCPGATVTYYQAWATDQDLTRPYVVARPVAVVLERDSVEDVRKVTVELEVVGSDYLTTSTITDWLLDVLQEVADQDDMPLLGEWRIVGCEVRGASLTPRQDDDAAIVGQLSPEITITRKRKVH
jgi:hypothetical protein